MIKKAKKKKSGNHLDLEKPTLLNYQKIDKRKHAISKHFLLF